MVYMLYLNEQINLYRQGPDEQHVFAHGHPFLDSVLTVNGV